jgi:hypothetical protein
MTLFRKFTLAAVSVTVLLGALVPAEAAMPLPTAPAADVAKSDVTAVQYYRQRDRYYGGYHGYRGYRSGYRRHNDGYWYPLAAFGAGAIIGGALAAPRYAEPRYVEPQYVRPQYVQPAPVYRASGLNPRHYEWCSARYRSYDSYTNSFQPYNGPRQACLSPFY